MFQLGQEVRRHTSISESESQWFPAAIQDMAEEGKLTVDHLNNFLLGR